MKKVSMGAQKLNSLRSILYCVGTFLLLFVLLLTGVTPDTYDIQIGQPASMAVYATKDVEDTITTEAMREAAANAVEPSYKSVDLSVSGAVINDITSVFASFNDIRTKYTIASAEDMDDAMLKNINRMSKIELDVDMAAAVLLCSDDELAEIAQKAIEAVRETLNSTLPEGQEAAAITRINRTLSVGGYSPDLISSIMEAVRSYLRPNMLIDTEITEENRRKARENVEPEILVKREIIVREGEIVTKAQYQMISELGLLKDDSFDVPLIVGLTLMLLTLAGAVFMYLRMFRPKITKDSKKTLVLCIIILMEVLLCVMVRSVSVYAMPVALCAILTTILVDTKTAMFISSAMSFIVAMLVSSDSLFSSTMFSVMLMTFIAGPVACAVLKQRTQRFGPLLAGFAVGGMNFVVTVAIGFIGSTNIETAMQNAFWALSGGMISSVLAIGVQALLEWIFNLATNSRLIELSNPNQPLLRRLLLEAPGTYHHSIIVANLAEAGVSAVGGNALLARVGAYYHDVGKLKRPLYFKENQMGDNPHDRTDPRVSAAILTAHPRDGVQLAQKEHLPSELQEIIRQHHGDSPVLYFYDKAVKLYGGDVDISAFRYEGPRPHSKEAAVVMLADTVEAATRTLNNPNQERIEQLIRTLIRKKLDDDQLNESDLSFGDLDKICVAFSTVLTGVFHERIEYPDITIPPRIMSEAELRADLQVQTENAEEDPQAAETAAEPDASETEDKGNADRIAD